MPNERMSVDEYKKRYVQSPRSSGSSSKDHAEAKALQQAVSTIRSLQAYHPPLILDGPYRLDVTVYARTRADEDNIRKAVNDAIQGCVVRNDRDSQGGSIELCGNKSLSGSRGEGEKFGWK